MHQIIERLERLLTLVVLLLLGISMTNGMLLSLTWEAALVGVLLVFVVRPLAAWLALSLGRRSRSWAIGGCGCPNVWSPRSSGVRGVGSVFYLTYATGVAYYPNAELLWATVGFTIALSVLVHGVLTTPAMRLLDLDRSPSGWGLPFDGLPHHLARPSRLLPLRRGDQRSAAAQRRSGHSAEPQHGQVCAEIVRRCSSGRTSFSPMLSIIIPVEATMKIHVPGRTGPGYREKTLPTTKETFPDQSHPAVKSRELVSQPLQWTPHMLPLPNYRGLPRVHAPRRHLGSPDEVSRSG